MARPPNSDLTRQQRRVLQLMASGQTNAQIAEALGITLDGAKYHVREVFDKLGVSSREEAVAAWRAGRPSLWQRLRGWLWPVGAVVAGVGVVAVATVVGLVVAFGGGPEPVSLPVASGTGLGGRLLWIAVAEQPPGSDSGTLHVFARDDANKVTSAFAKGGRFTAVGWSRDGRMLAVATKTDPNNSNERITIYDRTNWKSHSFDVEGPVNGISWSYDGRYLALLGKGVALSTTDGHFVASLPGKNGAYGWWSPGADAFAATIDGKLQLMSSTGESHGFSQPPNTDPRVLGAEPWADADTIRALAFRPIGNGNEMSTTYDINSSQDSGWQTEAAGTVGSLTGAPRALGLLPPNMHASQGLTADGAYGWSLLVGGPNVGNNLGFTLTAYNGAAPVSTIAFSPPESGLSIGPLDLVVTSGSG